MNNNIVKLDDEELQSIILLTEDMIKHIASNKLEGTYTHQHLVNLNKKLNKLKGI